MPKKLRNKLIHFVTKHLLKFLTEEDVLRVTDHGTMVCRGKIVTKEMQDQLQVEAEYIKNSVTYKLLIDDMRYLSNKTMFDKSKTYDDMIFGKVMLYVIDVLDKKINNLAK